VFDALMLLRGVDELVERLFVELRGNRRGPDAGSNLDVGSWHSVVGGERELCCVEMTTEKQHSGVTRSFKIFHCRAPCHNETVAT
jgi:hypothetical protein